MNIKKWMIPIIIIFGIVTITFYTMSFFVKEDWIEIVGVTCLTTYYQTCIRPLTGSYFNIKYHNDINYDTWWFREKKFEKGLYKLLCVRSWKSFMPTYDKDAFDIKKHSLKEIIGAGCQAELVHEAMLVESLLPLLLIIPYGRVLVFVLTTLACVIVESVFIIIQRFNRPRLIKVMKRQERLAK